MNRRRFLQTTAGAAAFLAAGRRAYAAFPTGLSLTKFHAGCLLPRFGTADIPSLTPVDEYSGTDYYQVVAGVFRQKIHPELPGAGPKLYGYADAATKNFKHLGGAVIATRGRPVRMKFASELPATHILPFDETIPMKQDGGADRPDRAAIHLHGGLVPWMSDGGPFHWVANPANPPGAARGTSCVDWLPNASGSLTDDYYYPNNQTARLMWYHDHAIGITRTNAYAGLATGYIIVDPDDAVKELVSPQNIIDGWDLPLVVQDHSFWDDMADPNYNRPGYGGVIGAERGDLWYPYIYDTALFGPATAPMPSAVPEFWASTMLVNGAVYPWHPIKPNRYRLRILNACNARFLRLRFVMENGTTGEPLGGYSKPVAAPVSVWQVGAEGGFLPAPVEVCKASGVLVFPLVLAPAERADLFVDFSACTGNVLLYNDAPAPYPAGSPLFDYYPGNNRNPALTTPGRSPNSRTLMRFVVTGSPGASPIPDPKIFKPKTGVPLATNLNLLPTVADPINGGLMLGSPLPEDYRLVKEPRELTLNEDVDRFGRLAQLIGTTLPVNGGFGLDYFHSVTENVNYGTIEIWNIYNLTADTHPMHFHLFNVMVLRRRPFRTKQFNGTPVWSAVGRGPDANETGWKETVQAHPGECVTVAALIEKPLHERVTVKGHKSEDPDDILSPRTGGHEFVWHCHILEHEEHDMMRPMVAR